LYEHEHELEKEKINRNTYMDTGTDKRHGPGHGYVA
jgi:hypothetical protein